MTGRVTSPRCSVCHVALNPTMQRDGMCSTCYRLSQEANASCSHPEDVKSMDGKICLTCEEASGRQTTRSFYEVYVWWCGVQGADPYPEDSPYFTPMLDGHYADAYAIWTEFCHA